MSWMTPPPHLIFSAHRSVSKGQDSLDGLHFTRDPNNRVHEDFDLDTVVLPEGAKVGRLVYPHEHSYAQSLTKSRRIPASQHEYAKWFYNAMIGLFSAYTLMPRRQRPDFNRPEVMAFIRWKYGFLADAYSIAYWEVTDAAKSYHARGYTGSDEYLSTRNELCLRLTFEAFAGLKVPEAEDAP